MILYEEYNKDRYDEDDVFEKMPGFFFFSRAPSSFFCAGMKITWL
jgi:hypothetical protein